MKGLVSAKFWWNQNNKMVCRKTCNGMFILSYYLIISIKIKLLINKIYNTVMNVKKEVV